MKSLLFFMLCAIPAGAFAAGQEEWINPLSVKLSEAERFEAVVGDDYFEVPASKLEAAQDRLSEHAAVPQKRRDAYYLGGHDFTCEEGKSLYLIRAVYQKAIEGTFIVQRIDDSLWVWHRSSGRSTGQHRSALMACLDFQPEKVFITTDSDM